MNVEEIIDFIVGLISNEYFLIGSAVICMVLAVLILLITAKSLASRIYVIIAGANLTIQGIHFLGVL